MFGLLYAGVSAVAAAISGIKCYGDNQAAKKRGYERLAQGNNYAETYFDRRGCRRLLSTDEPCDIRPDYDTHDEILYVGFPSHPVRNLSEEKRAARWLRTKNGYHGGRTVDVYDTRYWADHMCLVGKVIIKGVGKGETTIVARSMTDETKKAEYFNMLIEGLGDASKRANSFLIPR